MDYIKEAKMAKTVLFFCCQAERSVHDELYILTNIS